MRSNKAMAPVPRQAALAREAGTEKGSHKESKKAGSTVMIACVSHLGFLSSCLPYSMITSGNVHCAAVDIFRGSVVEG